MTFMMGHFTVDMFGGLMPVLYPLMATQFELDNKSVGFIALAYTGSSSLSQPLFGYLSDRFGSRYFAVMSMIWSATMVGLAGLSPNYGFLIFAATMAGLGSGAYHPQGASNAAAVAGDMQRNTAMSVYTVGGTSGYALGPLLGALVFAGFGSAGTLAVAPVGVIIAMMMLREFRARGLGLVKHEAAQRAEQVHIDWRPLAPVMAIVMIRSWVFLSVVSFIPLWFRDQGYGSPFYSTLTALVIGGGALGTLAGGVLADRLGERAVIGSSLIVSLPFLIVFALFPGPLSLAVGPLFGFFADMSISVTLVIAQRLLPGRVGVASGVILGMGFVTGGIGVPVTGAIADSIGTGPAILVTSSLLAVAAAVAMLIPRGAMRNPRSRPARLADI
ncbi:MAG TPA: MFS transporter [Thermomicrobiales bacterium]|nr:MFS transporter [Thermomicrobiales bacterium]